MPEQQPLTIEEAIEKNARGPASVTAGGQAVTAKPVDELRKVQRDQQRATGGGLRIVPSVALQPPTG